MGRRLFLSAPSTTTDHSPVWQAYECHTHLQWRWHGSLGTVKHLRDGSENKHNTWLAPPQISDKVVGRVKPSSGQEIGRTDGRSRLPATSSSAGWADDDDDTLGQRRTHRFPRPEKKENGGVCVCVRACVCVRVCVCAQSGSPNSYRWPVVCAGTGLCNMTRLRSLLPMLYQRLLQVDQSAFSWKSGTHTRSLHVSVRSGFPSGSLATFLAIRCCTEDMKLIGYNDLLFFVVTVRLWWWPYFDRVIFSPFVQLSPCFSLIADT